MTRRRLDRPTLLLLLAAAATPLWSATSDPTPSLSPEDQAADAYRRAVRYRDEALSLEEQATGLSGEALDKARARARKDFEKAARSLRSAVENDPSLYQAHSELGFVLRKLGDYEESLAAYEQALALEPGYTPAIEYRAEAHLGLGRLEEVKTAYLELFRSERAHADQLMTAMKRWVEERRTAPGDVPPAMIEQFAEWVAERDGLAGQAADLATGEATSPSW